MVFVFPDRSKGIPPVITTLSPLSTRSICFAQSTECINSSSLLFCSLASTG